MRLILVPLSLLPLIAQGATVQEVMFSRYLRAHFCMEKAYGKDYAPRMGLVMIVNHWGAPEPTLRSLMAQPVAVQRADAKCRKANELEDQLRP